MELKTISENILHFKNKINYKIDDILKDLKLKNKTDFGSFIALLGIALENDKSGVGNMIISEHDCFKGYSIAIFNQQTQRHDSEYIIKNLRR